MMGWWKRIQQFVWDPKELPRQLSQLEDGVESALTKLATSIFGNVSGEHFDQDATFHEFGHSVANWDNLSPGMQTVNTSGAQLLYRPALPHGAVLQSIGVMWLGATGHAALPATMPSIALYRQDPTGATTLLGSAKDGSTTKDGFEKHHTIRIGGLAEEVDLTSYRYVMFIAPESGANAVAGSWCYMPFRGLRAMPWVRW